MGVQAEIVLTALNYGPTDVVARTKLAAVSIADLIAAFDLVVTGDVTTSAVAGTIVRTINVTFGPTFLALYPTDAEQAAALRGTFRGVAVQGADHPQVGEAITIT